MSGEGERERERESVKTVGGGGGGAGTKMKMRRIMTTGGSVTTVGGGRGANQTLVGSGYGPTHLINFAPPTHLGISASRSLVARCRNHRRTGSSPRRRMTLTARLLKLMRTPIQSAVMEDIMGNNYCEKM